MTIHEQTHTPNGAPADDTPFNEAERNAMRAYLQRCEVRLSTLHRVAQAFFAGSGLLVLIPVFFKDAIDSIVQVMLAQFHNQFAALGAGPGLALTLVLFAGLLYPLALSLVIPLYGVYLLLKDIVHFYFTIYMPGFSENLLNPTFALNAVMFPVDESPRVKRDVMRYQYEATRMGFMIPFSKERRELYFDTIIRDTGGAILPESRSLERLKQLDVLPPDYDADTVNRFNAALGIARGLDRTLAEEVALQEMSLVRHVLYLRRLVLRYVKTLLMFIWTTVISFMMLPLLKDSRFPPLVMLALGYLVWSLSVMSIMNWPLYWLYRHRHAEQPLEQIDPQMRLMQDRLKKYCIAAIAMSGIAVALSLLSLAG
jgi:hypothetical protein